MNDIQKIGEVAAKYNISGRTLRYYEEIGILKSIRNEASQYRFYDQEAVNRLEQILFLRKIQIPVKDIQAIFSSQSIRVITDIFVRKLETLEAEAKTNLELQEIMKGFVSFLQQKTGSQNEELHLLAKEISVLRNQLVKVSKDTKIKKEVFKMPDKIVPESDIRIIELKPMKVAYYRAESASPEMDAWNVMMKWVREKRLQELATTRFFGFNNPDPSPDKSEYGYEVWVTVPDHVRESEMIKIKDFKGGLYSVTCCHLYDITEKWKGLAEWVKKSEYAFGDNQCLEETISPEKMPNENTQFDLFCPIQKN